MKSSPPPYSLVANRRLVLILAYCGHRRWVPVLAPMTGWQRGIEKCKPCPECGR